MKTRATALAGSAIALTATGPATAETLAEKGEAKLARMLDGRVAGEPVNCINTMRSSRLEVIEHVGLVYNAGDTIYVARPTDPKSLGRMDVLVIDRFGSQLCNTDLIRTVDRYQGSLTGVVFIDEFVPYRRS